MLKLGLLTLSPRDKRTWRQNAAIVGDPGGYLDVSAGVDFVNSISRRATRLPVQIVALNKHRVVTQAAHPHVPLALALQLHAFADVKPERGEQKGMGAEINLFSVHIMIYVT